MDVGLQNAVEEFLARFRAAWDAGGARAYAELFTEDVTYVVFLGDALMGRDEIERNHRDVFARWRRGTKMAVNVIAMRSLGPDVCSVLTTGGIGAAPPIAIDKLRTFTLVNRDGRWLCAAFQNTAMSERARSAYMNPAADPAR